MNKKYLTIFVFSAVLALVLAGLIAYAISNHKFSSLTGNVVAIDQATQAQRAALVKISDTLQRENISRELLDSINSYAQAIYNASLQIENNNKVIRSSGGGGGGAVTATPGY